MATFTLPLPFLPSKHANDHHRGRHNHRAHAYVSLTEPQFTSSTSHTLQSIPKPQQQPFVDDALPNHHHHHLLRGCTDIAVAKAVHAWIIKSHHQNSITRATNTLIATYAKLRHLSYAHKCFATLSSPDVISYSTIISALAKSHRENEAAKLFSHMRFPGNIHPNHFSFVAILTVAIRLLDSHLGSQVHALAFKSGYAPAFTYVSNALMAMYLKCGLLPSAMQLFEEMPHRDIASWTTLISGLVNAANYAQAFELFRCMLRSDGFGVDQFSLSTLLAASTHSFDCIKGRECHAHALRRGYGSNLSVNNALMGFYTKCGTLDNVVTLFERMQNKDVITWTAMVVAFMEFGMVESAVKTFLQIPKKSCISYNALLAGFCQNGDGLQALKLFVGMLERNMELSDFTLTSVVNACALFSEVEVSRQIHGFVTKFGFGSNLWIETTLLDMYTRCGRMSDAERLFDQQSSTHNCPVIWTSMICGYAREGEPDKALSFFCRMQAEGDVVVDEVASTAVLGVCGSLCSSDLGKQIHSSVHKAGFLSDLGVCNAIISMYSKCGDMEAAVKCFGLISNHDIVSWNTLISGYLLHRQGDKALAVWSKMKSMCIKPDPLTFVLVLSAYSHTNCDLTDDCRELFDTMTSTYKIEPSSEHFASMVWVLGYWGCYDEAEELINHMPFEPDVSVWRALLDSCRLRSNTKLGKQVAERLVTMEPQDPSTYILVSNLYAASGRWNCFERIRKEMREKGLRKHPTRSWLIHDNKIHSFYARDKSHTETKEIYAGLSELIPRCMKAGYVPDTSFVLHDVENHQKKEFLFYHSAKLAVTYGILYTRTVQVVKNVHLCGDCHTFFKYTSLVLGRDICLRDASGFHLFRNGECSCKDYW